ncbi:carbohydrate binding domain-containing protein [Flavobacteriaceae bacterium]|nr:carbohydrate binding domain-containing protein [Flavobacteriaceae bacterium]
MVFAAFKLSAQDYYVSALSGNDTNSGSENAPFATINKGIAAVSAGSTVYVMNGEYKNQGYGTASAHPSNGELSENMSNPPAVTINKSGTEGNYITIRNYPNHSPKIIFDGKGGILISGPQSYVIIEGFEVQGPAADITYDMAITERNWKVKCDQDGLNYTHNYFSGFGIWGGFSQNFLHHHIIVRNNIVHDTTGSGIRFNDSDHITIENNTVYNTTWWTSNASSAIVFAETKSQSSSDNGDNIKMIICGNTVYNNWNRIPFYMTQGVVPPNGNPPSGNYGNANYSTILDGQGLYVTRSDSDYYGTFLFENNLCVNNGKNGINFDRSEGSSALIRNNTIYFNGVHEIIQDISVNEGNPQHRGQKVAGIKSNFFRNVTVVNNIVVTREYDFFAMQLQNQNESGTVKVANNNIFVNGKLPGYTNSENEYIVHSWVRYNNQIINDIDFNDSNHLDPISFVNAPAIVNGPVDMSGTAFKLQSNSPAKDAGDQKNTPALDILGNPRPSVQDNSGVISSSSFEAAADGWIKFGDITVSQSTETAKTGSKSLKTSGRSANYHSPKINLNGLLTVGETYTFYVWVKLAEGSGSVQLVVKSTVNATNETDKDQITYINLASETATANGWVQLKDDYTHTQNDQSFLYIKGPSVSNEQGVDYFIDDFSLVTQATGEVDFTDAGNVVDIGAYEYQAGLSTSDNPMQAKAVYAYPNPTKDILTLINLTAQESVGVYDLLGRKQSIEQERNAERLKLNVSNLKRGLYFVNVSNSNGDTKAIRFIKK